MTCCVLLTLSNGTNARKDKHRDFVYDSVSVSKKAIAQKKGVTSVRSKREEEMAGSSEKRAGLLGY